MDADEEKVRVSSKQLEAEARFPKDKRNDVNIEDGVP